MHLKKINACVLIPTYNNEKTLKRVIVGVLEHCAPEDVIVINDGATDQTELILKEFEGEITILHNTRNRGKGYSLRKGFKEAISRGYSNAISIDSDGQHLAGDLPIFVNGALDNPGALLMGARNMNQEGVPGKSSFGNKFSNFWFWFETGIRLPDTQTGYRLYPLAPLKRIKLFTNKFETEIEVIVKMAWRDVPIVPVDIRVIYDKNERVTHFRPFRDFTRISILNTYLVTLTLLFYLHKRLIQYIIKKGLWQIIKDEALKPNESNFSKAKSIGFGLFMGIVPIWGFQLLVGIPLSVYFKMNKVLFITAANISLPPAIPLIIFASYKFGGLVYQNGVQLESFSELSLESIHVNFVQYFLGGTLLAVCVGLFGLAASYLLFKKFR